MYKFLVRNGQLLAFGVGILFTVFFLGSVLGGLDSFNSLAEEEQSTTGIFDFGLVAAIALAILCVIALVLFGIYHIVTDLKSARQGLIGAGALLVLFFIARAAAPADTGDNIQKLMQEFSVSDAASQNISGGIAFTLILMGFAAVAFIFSEIRNFFK